MDRRVMLLMRFREKSEALTYSVLINGCIVGFVYYYVQPDDKGIGFGLFLMAYGFLSSISGLLLQLRKWSDTWAIKCLVMLANLTNFFWVYEFARSIFSSFYENINSLSVPLYVFAWYGCYVSFKILYQFIFKG